MLPLAGAISAALLLLLLLAQRTSVSMPVHRSLSFQSGYEQRRRLSEAKDGKKEKKSKRKQMK
jgi:hypothetical protein